MKKSIFSVLVLVFTISSTAAFSAPTVKPLATFLEFPVDQDIAAVTISQSAIYIFGNTSTGAYISAFSKDGSQKWRSQVTDVSEFTFAVGAIDNNENIWIAGAAATAQVAPEIETIAPSGLNPDGIIVGQGGRIRPDLSTFALWKINPNGEVVGKYQLILPTPALPTSISINKSGISIVALQSAAALFINCDLNGKFSKPLNIGKSDTTLDAVIRNSDGSSILLGSSQELFLATKAIGSRDGIILKVDQKSKIIAAIRSGEKAASRNWNSATPSLLLGGYLKSKALTLATITKFSSALKPTWSTRINATSGAVTTEGPMNGFYAAYENNGVGTLTGLDKNGKILSSFSFLGKPISIQYSKTLGTYLVTTRNILRIPVS